MQKLLLWTFLGIWLGESKEAANEVYQKLLSDGESTEKPVDRSKSQTFREMVNTADYHLSMDLLANYPAGYNVMPVSNPHDVVNVSFQLALYHIVDMDAKEQTLTTNCEVITHWHDVFLMWDPKEYDNIKDTRLPWDKVWTPDIVLYNSAGDGEQGREMRTLIQVTFDGNVTLLTQSIYMSKCQVDVTYYPFDAQSCELKFASWSTEVTRLNMTLGNIDRKKILSLYSPSGVFELKKFYAVRHETPDPCCVDAFADVTYYLVIWRRPKFFLFNYIQPAVLINILALFVFLIPAESGEKITLGISTMLNMTVFLMTVMSGLPPTDQTPILSIYFAITMVLTTAATVLGVIVLRLHHQGRRGIPVPPYLRTTAKWMAVMAFTSYPPIEKQLDALNSKSKGTSRSSRREPREEYCYNIKEYDHIFKKKSMFSRAGSRRQQSRKGMNGLPINVSEKQTREIVTSDEENCESSLLERRQGESTPSNNVSGGEPCQKDESGKNDDKFSSPFHKRANSLWKKAKASPEIKLQPNIETRMGWGDVTSQLMEERYKEEERKEIIGEEWRKISRIVDRFLLILFVILSLGNTIWCIFASPHFPDEEEEDDDIPHALKG